MRVSLRRVWAELFKLERYVSGDVWNDLCRISVVVQSLKDSPPLTDDSILFRSDRVALAKVGGPALKGVMSP